MPPSPLANAQAALEAGDLSHAFALSQDLVVADSRDPERWYLLGCVLVKQGDYHRAAKTFRQALQFAPQNPLLYQAVAEVYEHMGAVSQAVAALRHLMALSPNNPDAFASLARLLRTQQTQSAPQNVTALMQKADALRDQGQFDLALKTYEQVDACDSQNEMCRLNMGRMHKVLGHLDQALMAFESVLKINPNNIIALNNLGVLFNAKDQDETSLAYFLRVQALDSHNPDTHCNVGVALSALTRYVEATTHYQTALALNPDHYGAQTNLALSLVNLDRAPEAVVILRRALKLVDNPIAAYKALSLAYVSMGREDEALACLLMSIKLEPNDSDAHGNLGVSLAKLCRYEEALYHYDQALALDPDAVDPMWNRSLTYLVLGRFEEGWHDYLSRWKRKGHRRQASYPGPEWDGIQSLTGKTIVVYFEQGFGDNIQCLRYGFKLRELGAQVVFHLPLELAELASTLGSDFKIVTRPQDTGSYHFHIAMVCLLRVFKTDLSRIPSYPAYLFADPDKVKSWQERLQEFKGYRVGIVWRGRPEHPQDRARSMAVHQLSKLLNRPGLSVVSLQYGVRPEELLVLRQANPAVFDASPFIKNFADTAAVVACLDLVISVDTSVVHVAGALGKPVWTLIAFAPDWRWLLKLEDTPWYPSMRLFRQSQRNDWGAVIERVMVQLSALL